MRLPKPGQISYGWWVLLACASIHFYFGGTFFHGFTAIFNPIAAEFGWSYALVSTAFSLRGFESGALAPVVGFFVDRLGPRKLLLSGVIIMGVSFWLFSRMSGLWHFYAIFTLLSIGLTLASGVVTMTAVAGWFQTRTSLAMGILTSGFGLSGLLVPAVVWLVDTMEWRRALSAFGIIGLILAIPLALVVKNPPAARNLSLTEEESPAEVNESLERIRTRDVFKSRNFWFLSLAVMFGGLAGSAVMVHQIPYMTSVGISRQTASFLVGLMSISDVAGRLGFGWLGDIFDKRISFVIGTLIKSLGVLVYAFSTSVGHFVPAMIVMGIGFGGLIPLRPALQKELFGMKSFALIQGLLMAFLTVGAIVAPPFAGWVFDTVGSYRIAFIILGIFTLAAIPLIMAVSKTPSPLL